MLEVQKVQSTVQQKKFHNEQINIDDLNKISDKHIVSGSITEH